MSTGSFNPRLFSRETTALVYNFKANACQRMLDFDFVCKRDTPSVAGLINPSSSLKSQKFFYGKDEISIPVFKTTAEAAAACPKADVLINFASFRKAFESTVEALDIDTIRTVAIIAEGVPESDARRLIALSKKKQKVIIGPATVGGIQAGGFKIANTGGTIDNIIASKLYRPGHVGFVSKSGGMSNEMNNMLAMTTDGLYEGIAIGGDAFPGSNLISHLLRYQDIPEIGMLVVLGEVGGVEEYDIVKAVESGRITKPVVAWVTGTCADSFGQEVQFGHAGAKSGGQAESARSKNAALRKVGCTVPDSYEGLPDAIKKVYNDCVAKGLFTPTPEFDPPALPVEFQDAQRMGLTRRATSIISTICNDKGEEPTYAKVPMSIVIEENYGIGDVICLLWFRKRLPAFASNFIEMCIKITADHGPCVSGAHNSIITARAGKDIVSCLCSGLLTIGPRFGGAIDDAAKYFKQACDREESPRQFVERMTRSGIRVPGIGHRIKSKTNPDKRVELLKEYAKKEFSSTRYLDFALEVEAYTLEKANNLILNVDGCIGVLFVDLLDATGEYSSEEIDEIISHGYLNAIFILGRSIGIIGHALDQKRMRQPLYRHPFDDVFYDENY